VKYGVSGFRAASAERVGRVHLKQLSKKKNPTPWATLHIQSICNMKLGTGPSSITTFGRLTRTIVFISERQGGQAWEHIGGKGDVTTVLLCEINKAKESQNNVAEPSGAFKFHK